MSSLVTESNGTRRIDFIDLAGKRQSLRLGRVPKKHAKSFFDHFCLLLSDCKLGRVHDDELGRWILGLDVKLQQRLERFGLIHGVGRASMTLTAFLEEFFKSLAVKASTTTMYGHTRRCLEAFFGGTCQVRSIGVAEAEKWRQWLKTHEELSDTTIGRRVGVARQMFRVARKWKLIDENSFLDIKMGTQENKDRMYEVTPDEARKVLAACPDEQWRLLFALSRYGGLRCPSEHLGLKWVDVDWERSRFLVHSPKTEHHRGHESRWVPIFPELRPYLIETFEAAEDGAEYVITRYRCQAVNLRTQLGRIIRRAGLKQWPKLWHNLRSTRQTELTERFPAHVVAAWLGNSVRVAERHYLQVTDGHFAAAIAGPTNPQQNPQQSAADLAGTISHPSAPEKTGPRENTNKDGAILSCATPCEMVREYSGTGIMGDTGFEPVTSCVSCMRSNQLS